MYQESIRVATIMVFVIIYKGPFWSNNNIKITRINIENCEPCSKVNLINERKINTITKIKVK